MEHKKSTLTPVTEILGASFPPPKPDIACQICGKQFEYVRRYEDGEITLGLTPMFYWRKLNDGHEDCIAALAQAEMEKRKNQLDRQYAERVERLLKNAGVSLKAAARMTFDTYSPQSEAAAKIVDRLKAWEPGMPGILLKGGTGVGKTHLMMAFVNHLVRRGIEVRFANVNRVFDELRAYDNQSEQEKAMQRIERSAVLILDDIGAEKLSEWAESKLERILTYRIDEELPVFLTSNLTREGFVEKFGDRVLSRIAGLVRVVDISGKDHRRA